MRPRNLSAPPGVPVVKPSAEEWLSILADGGKAMMESPYQQPARVEMMGALARHGYHYHARICWSGKLVPLLGREYFPSRLSSFSIFDADAAARGIEVIPVNPTPETKGWIPASIGIDQPDVTLRARPRWKRDHFVARIDAGQCVVSPWGYAVFARDGSYVKDFCCNDGPMIPWSGTAPPPAELKGTVAILTHSWSHAVFHWLLETIPRLHLLKLAGFLNDNVDHIVCRQIDPWHWEFIDRLGIPREKFVQVGHMANIKADTLLVCSNVEEADFSVEPAHMEAELWVTDLIANLVPNPSPAEPGERIYISRATAGSRRGANEPELRAFLERNGFRTVFFENMSLEEKAATLRSAAIVVAVAGAALTHIPLMNAGSKCVVLYTRDSVFGGFNTLCANAGVTHVHAMSPAMSRFYPEGMKGVAEHLRDILVDIPNLAEVLRFCGLEIQD